MKKTLLFLTTLSLFLASCNGKEEKEDYTPIPGGKTSEKTPQY